MGQMEKTRDRLKKLRRLLRGKKNLLTVLQDNPDPDAIAAALGLRVLVHKLGGLTCSIAHSGTVGRAENRAMVKYLGVNLRPFGEIDVERFDVVAMVDTQPGAGNNPLPEGVGVDIVIDHHPIKRASRRAALLDVRKGYGATATILYEYLGAAGITPDVPLATAIMYAIRSDTQDLGMLASGADIRAIEELYPLANKRMLSQIQRGQVQREYFRMLAEGLQQARVYGKCIMAGLGDLAIPDMIGEVADLLLRDDEAQWAMCYGFYEGKLLISLRTSEAGRKANEVMRKIVSRRGSGGGHDMMAGGNIPLKKGTKGERVALEKVIREKLLRALNLTESQGVKIVPVTV